MREADKMAQQVKESEYNSWDFHRREEPTPLSCPLSSRCTMAYAYPFTYVLKYKYICMYIHICVSKYINRFNFLPFFWNIRGDSRQEDCWRLLVVRLHKKCNLQIELETLPYRNNVESNRKNCLTLFSEFHAYTDMCKHMNI